MKKLIVLGFTITALLLAGCQSNPSSNPSSNKSKAQKTVQIIVPTLKSQVGENKSDFQLRSQTSIYLNKTKSKIKLTLTDDPIYSCVTPITTVSNTQTLYNLTIETDNGKAFSQGGVYTKLALTKLTSKGEEKINLNSNSKVEITAINSAIFRGKLNLTANNFSLQGEFFTALCK